MQRQNRAVCAGTKMPAHILPGTRGCSPSGAVLVRTYVSRASSGSVGRQPAARQGFARDGERRPRTARSLGARARQRRNPARLAGRQRLEIGHRFGGVGRKKHAHMHTCIQKATQHVTKHRHAVTRPCPRALSSPVRALPHCRLHARYGGIPRARSGTAWRTVLWVVLHVSSRPNTTSVVVSVQIRA